MSKKKKKNTVAAELDEFDFFDLDQNRLDEEWLIQPKLYFQHALLLAAAKETVDRFKSRLDVIAAELDQDMRADPEKYDMERVSEASIKAAICLQDDHEEATKDLARAKHRVDVLQAVINALEHRKRALEGLVTLHGQNYFSTPRVKDPDVQAALDSVRDKAVKGVKSG